MGGLGVRGEGSCGDICDSRGEGTGRGDVGGCCMRGEGEGPPIGDEGGGIGDCGGPPRGAMPPPLVDTCNAQFKVMKGPGKHARTREGSANGSKLPHVVQQNKHVQAG